LGTSSEVETSNFLDEAMRYLLQLKEKRRGGVKITDLAGSWDVSDEE
jgi:hypothetical protein